MHKIKYFFQKKSKKYVCLPCVNISDPLPEIHLFFIGLTCFSQSNTEHLDLQQRRTPPPIHHDLAQAPNSHIRQKYILVLQISRLSEGSTGQIFATSSVICQMKMLGL